MGDKEFDLKWQGVQAVIKWLSVLEAEGKELPTSSSIRFEIDAKHSGLLKRILEGGVVYSCPPPLDFNKPNYSLMEKGEFNPISVTEKDKSLIIDSHVWKVVEKIDKTTWIAKYKITKPRGDMWSKTLWRVSRVQEKWVIQQEEE